MNFMDRVKLLGYDIDTFSFDEATDYALSLEKQDKVFQVVTINPEMFSTAPGFIVNSAPGINLKRCNISKVAIA